MKCLKCTQETRLQGLYCSSEFKTEIFINSVAALKKKRKKKKKEDVKHSTLTCPVLKGGNMRSHQTNE